jgi:hypothetical protein
MCHIKHKTILFNRNHERKITTKTLVSLSRKREVNFLRKLKLLLIPLNARYYLKCITSPKQFLSDTQSAEELIKDPNITFLQIGPTRVIGSIDATKNQYLKDMK